MQYGLKVDIAFSGAKTIVSWLQRAIWNNLLQSKVLHSLKTANWNQKNVSPVLKCKKCFFWRKLTEISNLILFFSEIPKIFICVRVRQDAFLSEDWKCYPSEAVSSLQFLALEMRGRKAYRKQTGSNLSVLLNKVSALEHERFKQVSLYTASWVFANT